MAGRGHTHHALNDINRIRDLLDESYGADAVLKELIQNADDAGADELRLAVVDGLADCPHPLLGSPAVLILNDGELQPQHIDGIRGLGIGTKVGETQAIGKFGLGMKSVYHLCEAFFYLASANQPAIKEGRTRVDLLNPWSGSGIHDDWDEFEPWAEAMHAAVREEAAGLSRWFCLWLPLRQPQHHEGKYPLMRAYWPVGKVLALAEPRSLTALLPLLRSLRRITVQKPEGTALHVTCERLGSLEVRPALGRIVRAVGQFMRRRTTDVADDLPIRGHLRVAGASGEDWQTAFYGQQRTLADEELRRIHEEATDWPVRASIDAMTGQPGEVRHEVSQHAAVVFVATPADQAGSRLVVTEAAFLPVRDTETVPTGSGEWDYRLLLHGDFIPDTGRRLIKFDEPTGWNQRLRQVGVLQLVLPSLASYVDECRLEPREIERLTRAMKAGALWREHGATIAASGAWCRCLGTEGGFWRLLAGESRRWAMPTPPPDHPGLPFRVFPAMARRSAGEAVIDAGAPTLAATAPEALGDPRHWLVGLPSETLTDEVAFDYLLSTLEQEGERLTEDSRQWLVEWLREAIGKIGLSEARKQQPRIQRLVGFLPPALWVALPTRDPFVRVRLLEALLRESVNRLALPDDLASPLPPVGQFTVAEAAKLLRWLVGNGPREARCALEQGDTAVVARTILERTAGTPEERRQACGDLPLFQAYDGRRHGEVTVSWNALCALRARDRLFASEGRDYFEALQTALAKDTLYRLPRARDLAPVLFEGEALRGCGARDCLDVLTGTPPLAAAGARGRLLSDIAVCPADYSTVAHQRAVRYLLHGDAGHYHDTETALLGPPDGPVDTVVERLAFTCLNAMGKAWRYLPKSLESKLSGEQRGALNVSLLERSSLAALLDEAGVDAIAAADWSAAERQALLPLLSAAQQWTRLPWHETVDGRLAAIDGEHVFLAGADEVPEALASRVIILRDPSDAEVARAYQRLDLQRWSALAALEVALAEAPETLWREILDALDHVGRDLPDPLRERLRTVAWLPDDTRCWAPRQVVALGDLDPEAARLFGQAGGDGVSAASLSAQVTGHRGWAVVRAALLPDRACALALLRGAAQTCPDYAVGQVPEDLPVSVLLKGLDGFDAARLPAVGLLRALTQLEDGVEVAQRFLSVLRRPLPLDLARDVLKHLTQRQQDTPAAVLPDLHCAYLHVLVAAPGFEPASLAGLLLRDRRGDWRRAERLCLEAQGVDPRHLLATDQAAVLRPGERGTPLAPSGDLPACAPVPGANGTAAEVLRAYFAPWDRLLQEQRHVIGAFLALLGGDPDVVSLAEHYLGTRFSVASLHDKLPYTKQAEGQVGAKETTHQAVSSHRFHITVHPVGQRHCRVANLLGDPFDALLASVPEDLLVANPERNGRHVELRLREIDPAQHETDLVELLSRSAQVLWRRVYWQYHDSLAEVLADLTRTDQVDLTVVQETLLENCLFYLQQLKAGEVHGLEDLRERWDRACYGIEGNTADPEWRKEFRGCLRQRLETDTTVQAEVLQALRQRIAADYQYALASVPFELFQNSDDACVELAHMDPEATGLEPIRVAWRERALQWTHWGRRVNEEARGSFGHEEGQSRGYYKDLQKMLVVNASDKGRFDDGVTGKFGLGFKSVYLCSDAPRILSGRLGVEVIGGVWPRQLSETDTDRLKPLLAAGGDDHRSGTIVELPLRSDCSTSELMDRFVDLVPLLLVFARRLRRCHLSGPDGERSIVWQPRPLLGCPALATGTVDLPGQPSSQVLVFDLGVGQVLAALGRNGFRALPPSVPTFWVTAPTLEVQAAGFAVNAPFAVDVGRAQLARDADRNDKLADRLGLALGEALIALFDASANDWPALRAELRLAEDLTPYELWLSLFRTLSTPASAPGPAVDLARRMLWQPGHGLAALYDQRPALPTEVPAEHRCLTSLRDVKAATAGVADQERRLLDVLSAWPAFREAYRPGTVVSQEAVARHLPAGMVPSSRLHLPEIIGHELSQDHRLSPDLAQRLGAVLTPERWRAMDQDERKRLETMLAKAQLRSQDDDWQPAERLLPADSPEATLAPQDRLRHADYDDSDLLALGLPAAAPEDAVLADWAAEADTVERRQAALTYLVKGRSGDAMGEHLTQRGGLPWLDGPDDDAAAGFAEHERFVLAGRLRQSRPPLERPTEVLWQESRNANGTPRVEPEAALQAVADWWQREGPSRLPTHLGRLYHDDGAYLDRLRRPYGGTEVEREAWLTLLLRGSLESIGRSTNDQNRSFLQQVVTDGWLTRLAANPGDAEAIVGDLQDHLDQHAQSLTYVHWLRFYLPMAVMSLWIDDYACVLLDVERLRHVPDLDALLCPRINPEYSGGGPDAPPLAPLLGIGGCFVMRELLRSGLIERTEAWRLGYVPTQAVLNFLRDRLGGPALHDAGTRSVQSRGIYEFLADGLDDPTFGRSFDIPLQLLASDTDLADDVLGAAGAER